MPRLAPGLLLTTLLLSPPALAGQADVELVRVVCGKTLCDFLVTVRHTDTGPDHYADRLEVVGPRGEVLGTREFERPHVDEQPFTRPMNDVPVPADVRDVTVRAHDSRHGFGGLEVDVPIHQERPPTDRPRTMQRVLP